MKTTRMGTGTPLFGSDFVPLPTVDTLSAPRWLRLYPTTGDSPRKARLRSRGLSLYYWLVSHQRRVFRTIQRWTIRWRRLVFITVATTAILITLWIGVVVAYRMWHVPQWVLNGSSTSAEMVGRMNAYRAAQGGLLAVLVQTVAGIALFAGLFFTWRQIIVGQETHVSERFTRSVEQLANERVEVRIGGLQGLERIAFERDSEFLPIVRLLTVFVMERAQEWQRTRVDHDVTEVPLDLQLGLSVLVRFQERLHLRQRISLRGIDLSYTMLSMVDFSDFNLENANFRGSNLEGAWFRRAMLSNTIFEDANMHGANLIWANFANTKAARANLYDAYLRESIGAIDLRDANLTGADCEWAVLGGDFRGATLEHTFFNEASLSYCNFDGLDLRVTRGMHDGQLRGPMTRTNGTIPPGKDLLQAHKEATGRPSRWMPQRGAIESIRWVLPRQ